MFREGRKGEGSREKTRRKERGGPEGSPEAYAID